MIATLGLLLVIFALARSGRARTAPAAVGAYIGAAYWFTASTSFANPAITMGRMFSDLSPGSPVLGPVLHRRPGHRQRRRRRCSPRSLYPALTPAHAAGTIVPHHPDTGRGKVSSPHPTPPPQH